MNKATIIRKLHEITDHYLLGEGTCPADREKLPPFWKAVRELGLDEDVPGSPRSTRWTPLGNELNVDLVMAFVGAWDLWEIPGILESNGYMDEDEVDGLWTMPEIQFECALHRYVLRAYLKFCNRSKSLH
ncbi:MAG: hypothetical protein Q7J32_02760 [Sphingomonadaceae bacterium]|nr:hypothetical protein [Sphingomonadaceae bacterium]